MFKKNKNGSYIVEAAITLPVLIISICSLILIIKIIALCEAVTFTTSIYLMDSMFSNNIGFSEKTLCNNIKDNYPNISDFKVTKYRYLYDLNNIKDAISLDTEVTYKVINPIGINGNVRFKEKLLCRGFTGETQEIFPLDEYYFSECKASFSVYIFPKYGEKYHKDNCRYIKTGNIEGAYLMKIDREDALRKGYMPCVVCQGAAYEQ